MSETVTTLPPWERGTASERMHSLTPEGVPANKLDITDPRLLASAEHLFTEARQLELETGPFMFGADVGTLVQTHHTLFKDLYESAGQLRSVDIGPSHSEIPGPFVFHHPAADIQPAVEQCLQEHHQRLDRGEAPGQVYADTYTTLTVIQPFHTGSGAAVRAGLSLDAQARGMNIDWAVFTREGHDQALSQAVAGQPEQLRTGMNTAVQSSENDRAHQAHQTMSVGFAPITSITAQQAPAPAAHRTEPLAARRAAGR